MNASSHPTPLDPAIACWAEQLDAAAREYFEERAAILEFDGGLPRPEAERRARQETEAKWLRQAGR